MPPKISKVAEYSQSWWKWWKTLQPEWRGKDEGGLMCQVPEGEKWPQTCRGGANGFFMIVLTLAWWVAATDQTSGQSPPDADLRAAMEDVEFVLDMMLMLDMEDISAAGAKRSSDEAGTSDNVAVKKRYNQSFPWQVGIC
jgi:hypothetical protein